MPVDGAGPRIGRGRDGRTTPAVRERYIPVVRACGKRGVRKEKDENRKLKVQGCGRRAAWIASRARHGVPPIGAGSIGSGGTGAPGVTHVPCYADAVWRAAPPGSMASNRAHTVRICSSRSRMYSSGARSSHARARRPLKAARSCSSVSHADVRCVVVMAQYPPRPHSGLYIFPTIQSVGADAESAPVWRGHVFPDRYHPKKRARRHVRQALPVFDDIGYGRCHSSQRVQSGIPSNGSSRCPRRMRCISGPHHRSRSGVSVRLPTACRPLKS